MWLRAKAYVVNAIAVGNVSPGPTGLWSVSLGYLTYGWLGAGLALAALSLPPLLALLVSAFYYRLEKLPAVQDFTRGLSLGVVGLTLALPYTPVAGLFGFEPLSLEFLGIIGLIMVLYISAAELAKKFFYRHHRR